MRHHATLRVYRFSVLATCTFAKARRPLNSQVTHNQFSIIVVKDDVVRSLFQYVLRLGVDLGDWVALNVTYHVHNFRPCCAIVCRFDPPHADKFIFQVVLPLLLQYTQAASLPDFNRGGCGIARRIFRKQYSILASNGRLVERTPPWRGVVVLAPPSSFKEDTGPPSEFGLREHRRLPQGASPGASMYVPERFETIHVSLVLAPAAFMPAYDLRTSSPFAQRFSKI